MARSAATHPRDRYEGRFSGRRVNCEQVPLLPAWAVGRMLDDPRKIPYLLVWESRSGGTVREAAHIAPHDETEGLGGPDWAGAVERHIVAHDAPLLRRAAILRTATTTRGRPGRFPLARAFRNPARTRSTISDRSSSATAPRTVKTIRPAGVAVSSDSDIDFCGEMQHYARRVDAEGPAKSLRQRRRELENATEQALRSTFNARGKTHCVAAISSRPTS